MNQTLREHKQVMRSFIREHYTDQRLAEVLAHAQDGKFSYRSCCCLIGAATANHPLREEDDYSDDLHYAKARQLNNAVSAELSYACPSGHFEDSPSDKGRRLLIIPILRAEQKRRARLKELHDLLCIDQTVCAQR